MDDLPIIQGKLKRRPQHSATIVLIRLAGLSPSEQGDTPETEVTFVPGMPGIRPWVWLKLMERWRRSAAFNSHSGWIPDCFKDGR